MLSGLLIPALLVSASPSELGPSDMQQLSSCLQVGEELDEARRGWHIIDARALSSAGDLGEVIEQAREGSRIVVYGGDFTGQDMRAIAQLLSGACIVDTDLSETDWSGTIVSGMHLERVTLRSVNAQQAQWPMLIARGVKLEGADFTGANLSSLRFISQYLGASFGDVSFRDANLTNATFACGITSDVWCINANPDLRGADLTGADVSGLGLWDETRNAGAILNGTIVAPRSLAVLESARIEGPVVLSTYYTSPYLELGEERSPASTAVEVSADEARTLIAATIEESGAGADVPSFDCSLASTRIETMICGEYDYDLRQLDRELSEVWSAVRAAGQGSLGQQRRWLRSRVNCEDRYCLTQMYQNRIAQLRGLLGPGLVLAPDQTITYYSDILPLPDRLRSTGLYRRVQPALIDASYQRITLTGFEDGAVGVEGDAVGANAHTCGILVPEARFDPATGWWSAANEEDGSQIPLFRIDGRRLIMRVTGVYADTPDEMGDMIMCGARASFTDGIDLTPGQ